MARKKDTPQKAALREMMGNYLKENNVKVKDGTDVNSIMRDMMWCCIIILDTSASRIYKKISGMEVVKWHRKKFMTRNLKFRL